MSASRPLLASSYSGMEKRGEKLDMVRKELNCVINSLPTQIHPTERGLYLDAILDDLSDKDDAPWTVWPQDVYLLALTAIKSLGRNPVGSETLLLPEHFPILLHHSGLPVRTTFSSSRPSPTPFSSVARETLKILANLLVLHEEGRNVFATSGGAKAISRSLAGKDINGDKEVTYEKEEENLERLFLLGRLGFLVTIDRSRAVGVMVDTEDVVDSLVRHFTNLQPIPANHMALSELLKLTNNIIRFYPYTKTSSGSSTSEADHWDEIFDPLLYPILCQFYNIPFIDLSPPLSHAIHVLLSIPFLTRLLPTWHSVPIPPSPPAISANASPTSSVKNLLNKLSNMSTHQNTSKKSSTSPISGNGESLIPPNQRKTPSPSNSRRSSGSNSGDRPTISQPSTQDPSALPIKLLKVFDHFFESYIPWPKKPDDSLPQGLVLDEMLPPLLLLLTRAAAGSEPIRVYLKETLLPSNLDRSPEGGALESRKCTLGDILGLMGCAGHTQSRNTAGELMWAICKGDAADLCVEIGYGNAAGILFQKGLSGPPEAKIEEISDNPPKPQYKTQRSNTSINIQPATPTLPIHHSSSQSRAQSQASSSTRNPITSLSDSFPNSGGSEEMTEEEKELEAEKLFVLFDRLEKNPVISMKSKSEEGSEGEGRKISMMDMMREKLNSGEFENEDNQEEEHAKQRLEEQDKQDEEDAIKEMEEYKRRLGRK